MLNKRVVYRDGKYVPWEEAAVHIMSHSLTRGSAIFEVVGFHDTPDGPAVFRLDEHIARFWKSASILDMTPPVSQGDLQEAVLETIRRNKLKSGVIKIVGFYPDIVFSILPPAKPFSVAVVVVDPFEDVQDMNRIDNRGVTACVSQWRRLDPHTVPVEAKVAANYINGIMARIEVKKLGFDYAVMLDTQGYLAEGGTESLFLVQEGHLLTPSLGTILNGITRKTLIEVARAMGIETFAGQIDPAILNEVDEIFLSGTTSKVIPVRRMGKRILKMAPGPLTQMLSDRMATITSGRDRQFRHWLFSIRN